MGHRGFRINTEDGEELNLTALEVVDRYWSDLCRDGMDEQDKEAFADWLDDQPVVTLMNCAETEDIFKEGIWGQFDEFVLNPPYECETRWKARERAAKASDPAGLTERYNFTLPCVVNGFVDDIDEIIQDQPTLEGHFNQYTLLDRFEDLTDPNATVDRVDRWFLDFNPRALSDYMMENKMAVLSYFDEIDGQDMDFYYDDFWLAEDGKVGDLYNLDNLPFDRIIEAGLYTPGPVDEAFHCEIIRAPDSDEIYSNFAHLPEIQSQFGDYPYCLSTNSITFNDPFLVQDDFDLFVFVLRKLLDTTTTELVKECAGRGVDVAYYAACKMSWVLRTALIKKHRMFMLVDGIGLMDARALSNLAKERERAGQPNYTVTDPRTDASTAESLSGRAKEAARKRAHDFVDSIFGKK